MRHKVGAHKFGQITIKLFKSNCIYLDGEMIVKIQQFQLSKNKESKETRIAKVRARSLIKS